jgi:hypothetical protein
MLPKKAHEEVPQSSLFLKESFSQWKLLEVIISFNIPEFFPEESLHQSKSFL